MKIFNATYLLQFALLCASFVIISCSKDSDNTSEASTVIVTTSNFVTTILENPDQGQVIGTVSGTTNQGTVTFSINSQLPNGAIAINSSTGELTVADPSVFDFETNTSIIGIVAVTNGTVSENASINITIEDFNEDNIFEGSITLETQLDIDNFGANNYTHITENLFIGSLNQATEYNDLTPLNTIKHVGNQLNIYDNNELTSLTGLENIETAGTINIYQNDVLTDISALSNITELPLSLRIETNPLLANLNGLHNLTAVTYLIILNNNSLENLDDLHISTAEYLIRIGENDILKNIDGLSSINSANGIVLISYNNSLTNIDGLSNLSTLTEDLIIESNTDLTDFCGI